MLSLLLSNKIIIIFVEMNISLCSQRYKSVCDSVNLLEFFNVFSILPSEERVTHSKNLIVKTYFHRVAYKRTVCKQT